MDGSFGVVTKLLKTCPRFFWNQSNRLDYVFATNNSTNTIVGYQEKPVYGLEVEPERNTMESNPLCKKTIQIRIIVHIG